MCRFVNNTIGFPGIPTMQLIFHLNFFPAATENDETIPEGMYTEYIL